MATIKRLQERLEELRAEYSDKQNNQNRLSLCFPVAITSKPVFIKLHKKKNEYG